MRFLLINSMLYNKILNNFNVRDDVYVVCVIRLILSVTKMRYQYSATILFNVHVDISNIHSTTCIIAIYNIICYDIINCLVAITYCVLETLLHGS